LPQVVFFPDLLVLRAKRTHSAKMKIGYCQLVKELDRLVDEVGEDENHPLASMMEVIGVLIEKYEDENVAELA